MRCRESRISLVLLLISAITVQRSFCNDASGRNISGEQISDTDADQSGPPAERQKRSKVRHRSNAYSLAEEEPQTTTPAPGKLTEREIIEKVLKTNDYDWRVRPVGLNNSYGDTGGPVKVTVNIYLRSISKIDDVNMEYSAQFTFRETWSDRRLAYERMKNATNAVPSFIVLAVSDTAQQIWMPDTFFQNEKEARKHMIDKPNVLIRIYPNGEILYSVRLSMVLSCPMSLEYYPLDEQKCLIELASYAYTTDDIVYEWKNDTPVQQKDGLGKSLPSFELQAVKTGYCTSTTNTGQYSCLRTELILRREFSYYLLQLYIPSFMLVIVSWVSFWLDKDSVPARVTLGVTTLLTMTTQSSGINAKLPPVSYTKAIDVWIGVCLAFIFGALLEFALVNYAARKDIMRNVSGAMRRTRRPGISTAGGPPIVDPSLESLTMGDGGGGGGSSHVQHHQQQQQPPPPMDDQCTYNTFMMVMCHGANAQQRSDRGATGSAGGGGGAGYHRAGTFANHHYHNNKHAASPSYLANSNCAIGSNQYYRPPHAAFVAAGSNASAIARGHESASSSSSCSVRQNPMMKTPSPMMLRHPQDMLPPPSSARNAYNQMGGGRQLPQPPPMMMASPNQQHQYHHQQQQQQHHQFQNSPISSSMPPPQHHQQQQPMVGGSNGRLPNQIHPNHVQQSQHQMTMMSSSPASSSQTRHSSSRRHQRSCMDLWLSKYKERSKRIDVVSRLVFPVGFFIFNCVYWTVYML